MALWQEQLNQPVFSTYVLGYTQSEEERNMMQNDGQEAQPLFPTTLILRMPDPFDPRPMHARASQTAIPEIRFLTLGFWTMRWGSRGARS